MYYATSPGERKILPHPRHNDSRRRQRRKFESIKKTKSSNRPVHLNGFYGLLRKQSFDTVPRISTTVRKTSKNRKQSEHSGHHFGGKKVNTPSHTARLNRTKSRRSIETFKCPRTGDLISKVRLIKLSQGAQSNRAKYKLIKGIPLFAKDHTRG